MHVKLGTRNIQNDYHQWLSDSFRVHQIRFCPGPHWEAYSAPPDSLAGLRGHTSKGRGRKIRKGEGRIRDPP